MTNTDPIIDILRNFTIRHDPWRVEDAVDALTVIPYGHVTGLTKVLSDPDDELRLLAVEILYSIGQKAESALPALIRSLNDEDRIVRIAAVEPVANFGNKAAAAVPILEGWLDRDDDEFSRVTSAAATIQIDPGRADDVLPILIDALESDDFGIRCHAAWSTGQLGAVAREAVPALRRIQGAEATLDRLVADAITNITSDEI